MDLKISGKTVFVSGSTSGIGYAIAQELLDEGAKVIIHGRSKKSIEEAIFKLHEQNREYQISGLVGDFSNLEDVRGIADEISHVDILINNVGIYKAGDFFESTVEDWQKQIDVNVTSSMFISKLMLPKLIEKGWGRIMFISSECAVNVPTDLIQYSMTKAALNALSRGLAQLTTGTDVTVNTIMPGSTWTGAAAQFFTSKSEETGKSVQHVTNDFFRSERSSSISQRFATTREIATTVAYYCSPLSAMTNGAVIKVDGGSVGGIQ